MNMHVTLWKDSCLICSLHLIHIKSVLNLSPSLSLPFFCFLYAFVASHSMDKEDKSEIKKFEMNYSAPCVVTGVYFRSTDYVIQKLLIKERKQNNFK